MGLRTAEHRVDRLRGIVAAEHRRHQGTRREVLDEVMAGDPRIVLIANPGADLYGSDRMTVESVKALVTAGYRVFVTVPGPGPLIGLLTEAGATVLEQPTPIIRKSLLSPAGLVQLAKETAVGLGTVLAVAQAHQRRNCGGQHDHPAAVVPAGSAGGTSGGLPCPRGGGHGEPGAPHCPVPAARVLPADRH